MKALAIILWLSWVALLPAVSFAEQNVNPGINDHYQNPDVSRWIGVFERDGREVWDHRAEIIKQLHLRAGQRVADIGAGTGFFTLLMAKEVGAKGRLYAVDIAQNFVDGIERRAKEQGLDNVVGVVNDQSGVGLSSASVDLVFISDTYHHFEYPQSMLSGIHSALADKGELIVIDFKRIPGQSHPWVLGHVRAGKAEVVKEIEAAGFELTEQPDFMQGQYFLRFRKR